MDLLSYLLGYSSGKSAGKGIVIIQDEGITCTDDGEGNITITTEDAEAGGN